jgi:hypothetical protein
MNSEAYPRQGPKARERIRVQVAQKRNRMGTEMVEPNRCKQTLYGVPAEDSPGLFPRDRHSPNLIALHRPNRVRFEPAAFIAFPVLIPRTGRQGAREVRNFAGSIEYGWFGRSGP